MQVTTTVNADDLEGNVQSAFNCVVVRAFQRYIHPDFRIGMTRKRFEIYTKNIDTPPLHTNDLTQECKDAITYYIKYKEDLADAEKLTLTLKIPAGYLKAPCPLTAQQKLDRFYHEQ